VTPQSVTALLLAWNGGDPVALDALIPIVYKELHRIARRHVAREQSRHPLQTTALVHEAYLRLIDASQIQWQNRAHFFAVSANIMRRILVDYARSQSVEKRGGQLVHISLDSTLEVSSEELPDLISLDDALKSLAVVDPRKSRVVELRFFAGLTAEETACVLDVSVRTVLADWSFAKAWLKRELSPHGSDG
jgi:RNA polymerase sigma factor (TIGR02999 family)